MHILLVDPNEAFATLLSEELKRKGYEVDMCLRGADALMVARRQHIDLAILDMALATPDAVELAQALRGTNALMRLMLIPLMGETLSPQAAALSVQGVLPKPFFLPELPGLIEAAFAAPLEGVTSVVRVETPPVVTTKPSETTTPSVPVLDVNIFGPEIGVEPVVEIAPREEAPAPAPASVPMSSSTWEMPARGAAETKPASPDAGDSYGISYDVFIAHRLEVEQAMNLLLNDVGADAVLLTFGGGLLTWVGGLDRAEAESISRAIIHGWRTSAEVARILGREQVRFEQSIAGDDYMLYALSVEVNVIMGVAVRGSAPLGLMRHHARNTVDQIARLCRA